MHNAGVSTLDPRELSERIALWTRDQVERLVVRYFPVWEVPRVFAGFPVGPDVRADLVYTLGLLDAGGHTSVAGIAAREAIARVLQPIDGPATNTFASYRVAETLARYGSFESNTVLAGWSEAERANLAEACDSSGWLPLLDLKQLPANYAAVLARCELARRALGLPIDDAILRDLVDRVRGLLTRHPLGWHDDSPIGAGRYDIYTADLYLFVQPLIAAPEFAAQLADPWQRGVASVLELAEKIGARNGAAFTWGRSTGALSVCLTIELAALAVRLGVGDAGLWLGRAAAAFEHFKAWMRDDLIDAHRNRSPYSYRGPQRLLQMTLDALGKLAWAARELAQVPARAITIPASLFPEHDAFVAFSDAPPLGVWTHRSRALSFVVPFVGSTLNDYLPAPQSPGFLEIPIETDLPTGVPSLMRGGTRFTAGGAPIRIVHDAGRMSATWERFPRAAAWDCTSETSALAGSRSLDIEVRGGLIHAREQLHFDEMPDTVALQFTESAGRRLRVSFESDTPHRSTVIETGGIKEYRSFWGELPRVHQIDIDPAADIRLQWSVAPVLRVASSASHHHYHRSFYDPLVGRVDERTFPYEWLTNPRGDGMTKLLRDIDIFHLHWPEWVSQSIGDHHALIERLQAAAVRILWTQHNLLPHSRDEALVDAYRVWASVADAVVHHSRAGEARVRDRYQFRSDALHRVIPHPHFGHLSGDTPSPARADVERELGLRPCAIRLAIIGAPRPEKDVQLALDAFAACRRDDLGLLVLSGAGEQIPADPRITAHQYEMVDRTTYDRRLAAVDVLVFPIQQGELLTSGVVGDAVAAGLPSLISDWDFLSETLEDAAICYGRSREDLTACLDRLSTAALARCAEGARRLQPRYAREQVAEQLLDLLTEVGSAKL